jgi:hypothetical protein
MRNSREVLLSKLRQSRLRGGAEQEAG